MIQDCGREVNEEGIPASRGNSQRLLPPRYCTVKLTTLLFTFEKVAATLITVPVVALADIVPVVLPLVRVRAWVLEFDQVTEVVMSVCELLPGNVARALNVTVLFTVGLVGVAVNIICVGVPSVTVTVVVAGVAVSKAALICDVQTPVTVLTGVINPLVLMVAQAGVAELQITFDVRLLVDPSL